MKLQEVGFVPSKVDLCLLYRRDDLGICILIMHIDDLLIIGKTETINQVMRRLHEHFQVKKPTTLDDYLGVQVVKSKDGAKAWLGQPTILASLKKTLEKM